MRDELAAQLRRVIENLNTLPTPYSWLSAIRKEKQSAHHTACLLLGDILAAYSGSPLPDAYLGFQGDELLLNYPKLAQRLGMSERSMSRLMKVLADLRVLTLTRRDRTVNGKAIRQVVGVVPNLKKIEAISKPRGDATMSSWGCAYRNPVVAHASGRTERRTLAMPDPKTASWEAADDFLCRVRVKPDDYEAMLEARLETEMPLAGAQETVLKAFGDVFEEIVECPYRRTWQQRYADRSAARGLNLPKKRGGGLPEYRRRMRKYLQELTLAARQDPERIRRAALDDRAHARPPYTLEAFVQSVRDTAG